MKTIIDPLGRTVHYNYPPKKIISLAPAITQTMYHLSLTKEIVGRTRFCIHPKKEIHNAINIGGTKDIKLERIRCLNPDLIIAEKEENTKEIVETLDQYFPVFVFEVQSVKDALMMVKDLGDVTARQQLAKKLAENITKSLEKLPKVEPKRVAYMIWKRPYMVVGQNTYIDSLLNYIGWKNSFATSKDRYPMITIDELKKAELDYLFLATEPYPFNESDVLTMEKKLANVRVKIIDGEMFWYGAQMTIIHNYFTNFINELHNE